MRDRMEVLRPKFRQCTIKAYAKINTYLDVLGQRSDGYHEICSHMQLIDLSDTLYFDTKPSRAPRVSLFCDDPRLPLGEDNLICRAANAFFKEIDQEISVAVDIRLQKNIPMQAGLAGGSADAAATLRGLNAMFHTPFSTDELCRIGATIGADVPFCIKGIHGAQTARGIGEQLEAAPMLPSGWTIVVVSPGTAVSTPQAFRLLDEQMGGISNTDRWNENGVRYQRFLSALERRDIFEVANTSLNRFEDVILPLQSKTSEVFSKMKLSGAFLTRMSGSGPTVLGYFTEENLAIRCADRFQTDGYAAYVAHPINRIDI